jgi:Tol biopolymer transport system component
LDWPSTEGEPRWSPDGSTIAFVSDHDASQPDVWTIPADGGEPTRVTMNAGGAGSVRWMRDGESLLYVGRRAEGGDEIYRVPRAGGPPQALGAGQGGSIWSLTVSPDGSQVAYSAFLGGWAFVEVIPTTGGTPRRLTTRTETVYHDRVLWSTDGARLVVSDYDYPDDSYDLDLVSWPDGEWSALTESPGSAEFPEAWTPDGHHVVYMWGQLRSRIMSVSVADLIAGTAVDD